MTPLSNEDAVQAQAVEITHITLSLYSTQDLKIKVEQV